MIENIPDYFIVLEVATCASLLIGAISKNKRLSSVMFSLFVILLGFMSAFLGFALIRDANILWSIIGVPLLLVGGIVFAFGLFAMRHGGEPKP